MANHCVSLETEIESFKVSAETASIIIINAMSISLLKPAETVLSR